MNLRQFNPDTANIGDEVLSPAGYRGQYRGSLSYNNKHFIELNHGEWDLYETSELFQAPLCYVEDKPVYPGDVLYSNLSAFMGDKRTVIGISKGIVATEECGQHTCLPSSLTWTKPVIMEKKSCWMNCYKDSSCNILHPSREVADRAKSNQRIACVEITWEQPIN